MKKKKGFTLVELLAVIVILAVILVIAVPRKLNLSLENQIQMPQHQILFHNHLVK